MEKWSDQTIRMDAVFRKMLFGIDIADWLGQQIFIEEEVMRNAVLIALAVFALTMGNAHAQQVPTWDGEEWTFPVQDASDDVQGLFDEAVPASSYDVVPAESYESYIYEACAREGCDPQQLIRVMYCESDGDHSAVGPNDERGIMQIHPNGLYSDYYWSDPKTQIDVAADAFARGVGSIYYGGWVCQ